MKGIPDAQIALWTTQYARLTGRNELDPATVAYISMSIISALDMQEDEHTLTDLYLKLSEFRQSRSELWPQLFAAHEAGNTDLIIGIDNQFQHHDAVIWWIETVIAYIQQRTKTKPAEIILLASVFEKAAARDEDFAMNMLLADQYGG